MSSRGSQGFCDDTTSRDCVFKPDKHEMNKYFGTASAKTSKQAYEKNKTLAAIRVAIMNGKVMKLGTSHTEKWHTILRDEFPDVKLKIVEDGVMINEKS